MRLRDLPRRIASLRRRTAPGSGRAAPDLSATDDPTQGDPMTRRNVVPLTNSVNSTKPVASIATNRWMSRRQRSVFGDRQRQYQGQRAAQTAPDDRELVGRVDARSQPEMLEGRHNDEQRKECARRTRPRSSTPSKTRHGIRYRPAISAPGSRPAQRSTSAPRTRSVPRDRRETTNFQVRSETARARSPSGPTPAPRRRRRRETGVRQR